MITAPVPVRARIEDPTLVLWKLAIWERDQPATLRDLAEGTTGGADVALTTLDPSLMQNGQYELLLSDWDASGRQTEVKRSVILEGNLKLGHFSLNLEEFTVPLLDVPITLLRSYDTRRANEALDFGQGWSLGWRSVRIHENRILGRSWRVDQVGGLLGQQCIRANAEPIVTVTLPDGKVEKFRAKVRDECLPVANQIYVTFAFEPMAGTWGTLEELSVGLVRLTEGDLIDASTGLAADPNQYRYTAKDGTQMDVLQGVGITTLRAPSGVSVTFAAGGITHSSGTTIRFERDARGRIEAIEQPDGRRWLYRYNTLNELTEVQDPLGRISRMTYHGAPNRHFLRDLHNGLGQRITRLEYIAEGRLVKSIDGLGRETILNPDLPQNRQTVRDRTGAETVYVFDDEGNILTETNALGETITRTYDVNRNVLTETNDLGETTTYTYDAKDNRITETNDVGETTTTTYTPMFNQVASITNDLDEAMVMEYFNEERGALRGKLLATVDALGRRTEQTYYTDPQTNTTSLHTGWIDAMGQATQILPSNDDLPVVVEGPDGSRTVNQYDAMRRNTGNQVTRKAPGQQDEVLTTVYGFDDAGQMTSTTHPDGTVTRTEFDEAGRVKAEVDVLGRRTTHVYDANGQKLSTTYPDNSRESWTYDEEGRQKTHTDVMGRVTTNVLDELGRVVGTIYPDDTPANPNDNPRTSQTYDRAGRMETSTDERGNVTRYRYDRAGRQVAVVHPDDTPSDDADNPVSQSVYDEAGRRIASIDPKGSITQYVHDEGGQLREVILPDTCPEQEALTGEPCPDDGDDSNNARVTHDYDDLGRKTSTTDEMVRTTVFEYDPAGRLKAVIDALNQRTEYSYDTTGNKLTQQDASQRITRWTYDRMGRALSRRLPLGQTEQMTYDIAGRMGSSRDFMQQSTDTIFDVRDRPERVTFADGRTRVYGYNTEGQVTNVTTSQAGVAEQETRDFDARSRLKRTVDAEGRWIEYLYDAAGNRTQVRTATRVVDYGYDEQIRLKTVTEQPNTALGQTQSQVTTYTYDRNGSRSGMTYPNGTRVEYRYNARNQLIRMRHMRGNEVLLQLGYVLNPDGTRDTIIESIHSHDSSEQPVFTASNEPVLQETRRTTYTYDPLKRLVEENVDAANSDHDRRTSWVYDATGNRELQTQERGPVGTPIERRVTGYAYDNNDRLLSEQESLTKTESGQTTSTTTATSHAYDNNGNLTRSQAGAKVDEYDYNSQNQLVEYTGTENGTAQINRYRYNAEGIRRSIERQANGQTLKTSQLIDPNQAYAQVLEEFVRVNNGPEQIKTVYTFGDDLIAQHALRDRQGLPIAANAANGGITGSSGAIGATSYLHYDGLGTTRFLTNPLGVATDRYVYEAFGEIDAPASVMTSADDQAATDFLFTGEQFDPNLGFYYLRARYMDPGVGRFVTLDTWMGFGSDPVTLHKYIYANVEPTGHVDPTGKWTLSDIVTSQNIQNAIRAYDYASFAVDLYSGGVAGGAKAVAEEIVFGKLAKFRPITKMSDQLIGVFSKIWSRGVKLKLGLPYNSKTLGHNMEEVLGPLPPGHIPHHIVPNTSPAMDKLRDFKIDPNSPSNGVALPKTSSVSDYSAAHNGRHCGAYYQFVERLVASANTKEDVVNALSQIRAELLSGAAVVQRCQ
ncbi:MAG: AHH domain-containing protein [Ahniella sp.]|nr:AHH domain-containing protein [Ahniella sp.]